MKKLGLSLLLLAGVAHADDDEVMGRRVQLLLRAHQAEVFGCVGDKPVLGEALLHVVIGDGLPAKVEVLKADADAQKAARCVSDKARHWDLSSLRASAGDQVVFPLAFKPAQPDQSAVHATMRVQKLAPSGIAKLEGELVHAVFVVEGSTKDLEVGDVVYVDQQPSQIAAGKKGATLVIVESPRTTTPIPNRVIHPPKPYGGPGEAIRLYLDGLPTPFALEELCMKAGASVPPHVHDGSDELVYMEHGASTTVMGDAQTVTTHQATDEVVIPRGTRHAFSVQKDMCAVQVYAPPGPEQRFKK